MLLGVHADLCVECLRRHVTHRYTAKRTKAVNTVANSPRATTTTQNDRSLIVVHRPVAERHPIVCSAARASFFQSTASRNHASWSIHFSARFAFSSHSSASRRYLCAAASDFIKIPKAFMDAPRYATLWFTPASAKQRPRISIGGLQ